MDDHFRVASGVKAMPRLHQNFAQFQIIEDFAVERYPNASIFVRQRLRAPFKIDDAQAGMPQSDLAAGIEVDAAAVGTAMAQRRQHAADGRLIDANGHGRKHRDTRYSTHGRSGVSENAAIAEHGNG